MTSEKLSHDEVTKVGAKVDERFSRLLTTFVEMI
jgi:purine nucleoside phosphorylase